MKNKKWVIGIVIVFIVIAGATFWFYRDSKPTTFLTIEEVTDVLLKQQEITSSIKILDVFEVEESYRIVPFATDDGRKWMSYWTFDRFSWKLVGYERDQYLKLLQLRPSDPKSYYFVWHFAPQEEVTQMNLYFLQDRNYYITGDNQFYIPRIQLQMNINLTENSYGVQSIPEKWLEVMAAMPPIEEDGFLSPTIEAFPSYYFGLQTLDGQDQVFPLKTSQSSESYWFDGADFNITHVVDLMDEELEKP